MKPNKLKRHFETLHARCKKPHTIAEELILPAAIEIGETMFGDNFANELQSIPLSNDTVSRLIDDIAEDVEQQLFGAKIANERLKRNLLKVENQIIISFAFRQDSSSKPETDKSHLVRDQDCMADGEGFPKQDLQ
ncbi:SCAN domain-containing protein 3 [Trichonephila clavipes]|nr:SCAN domain-containing protein 3 [Trichonephila clavipes]